ncbi:MAG: prenyltransferase/squalene oxidase repeat-containing protein [bacterium]|nr:prenyltransferase/squalene oxidase repeat-containing protein [bacterium]
MISLLGAMKMKKRISAVFLLVLGGLLFAGSVGAAGVTVSLRHQETMVLDHVLFELPDSGTISVTDIEGIPREVDAKSVLGVLAALAEVDPTFALSQIQYFPSFDSLLVNCIFITSLGTEKCDNWLYAVNAATPEVGMDKYVLNGGETVYVYFGPSRQVVLSLSSVEVGTQFTASSQEYNYKDNTWTALLGVTIGITQPDPDNPWSPLEIQTSLADENGQAVFSIEEQGQYQIGIKEDFYFPSAALEVRQRAYIGGVTQPATKDFQTVKALDFLASQQNEQGSFGAALLSDWVAIAFGASGKDSPAKERLQSYLLSNPDPGTLLTDQERRAMALMALGINPATGTSTNHIKHIVDAFDGKQFGNAELVNDDIFALVVLNRAGYGPADEMIQQDADFVLSSQDESGSFGDVDLTAAAIQALVPFSQLQGVEEGLAKALSYVKSREQEQGSFGNVYATSWALQALSALSETPDGSWLASQQAPDGGLEEADTASNRVWATSLAIPAALGKPWGDILFSFEQGGLGSFLEKTKKLQEIEQEVNRIALEVEALKPQVAALYTAYLAQKEQENALALTPLPEREESVQLGVLGNGTITFKEERIPEEGQKKVQFTAEAAGTVQDFFSSGPGQAILFFGVGIALFLVLGGWKVVLSSFSVRGNMTHGETRPF